MNMLTGRIDGDGGRFVTGDGIALPVGRPLAAAPAGRPVVYGMRPEHRCTSAARCRSSVVVVEPTGLGDPRARRSSARPRSSASSASGMRPQPGETIRVRVDPSATHLFDAGSGARISA